MVARDMLLYRKDLPPELEPFRHDASEGFSEWLKRQGGGMPGSKAAREATLKRWANGNANSAENKRLDKKRKGHKPRGKPLASEEDCKKDERIHDGFKKSVCRTFLEYTESFRRDLTPEQVKAAVDRHRQRLRRRSNSAQ
jgi:hypothetical protein